MLGRLWCLALGAVLASGFLPAAGAGSVPACSDVTDDRAVRTGDVYVRPRDEGVAAWEEANGLDGLQTQACQAEGGTVHDADARVQAVECEDAEDPVASSPPGQVVYGPLPGTFCELGGNYLEFVEDPPVPGDPGAPGVDDVRELCNELVRSVPPRGLQCL